MPVTVGDDGPLLSLVAGDYRERPAAEGLRPAVRCVWRNELRLATRPLLVVPDGCIDLYWTGRALRVAGPDTAPIIEPVPPYVTIVGIRFHPGAAMPWLKVPATEIANRRLPLAELWGRHARQLEEQLFETATPDDAAAVLEQSLSVRMCDNDRSIRAGQSVRRALEGRERTHGTLVRDLASSLGVSERTIRRRCDELFGYGPKTLARILRFQRFLAHVRCADPLPLATLAGLCGYADQAHLSREVRRLSSLTPTAIVEQLVACRAGIRPSRSQSTWTDGQSGRQR